MKTQRNDLLVFLCGSKVEKENLRNHKLDLFQHLRKRRMVQNFPSDYVFVLKALYQETCEYPWPVFQRLRPPSEPDWYPGGSPRSYLPFPVPDPSHPWGSEDCEKCNRTCSGHYLPASKAFEQQEEDQCCHQVLSSKWPFSRLFCFFSITTLFISETV